MNCQLANRAMFLPLLLLLTAACGHDSHDKLSSVPPVRVKTLEVTDDGIDIVSNYSGTVAEGSGTVVSFSTAGTIKTLSVKEGDRVSKGQLIGTLDDGTLRNANDIAQSTLSQARDAYRRMKMLHDSNSLPEMKWVEVESKLRQAESAARIAEIALEDAKLYAPVSGVISEKTASVGQTIAPGLPVVKIVDIATVKVEISVPENEIASLPAGSTATIRLKSNSGTDYTGTLVEKSVVADPLSRSYTAKYQVDNRDGQLLPGMICDVTLSRGNDVKGVILPLSSVLLSADNTNFVWLDSAGEACRRVVVPGEMLPEGVMIVSGLNKGDKVIVAGTEKVSRHTKVESVN